MPDQLSPRVAVAAARRILAMNGCESGVGGQVSMRAANEEAFWVTPFQYFDETLPADVSKMDFNLRVLEGTMRESLAAEFHRSFYRARPDVNAIVHTHSFWVTVLSTTNTFVGNYDQDAAIFHDQQAFYEEDGIRPLIYSPAMLEAIGDRSILLLPQHGSVVLGPSVESATITAMTLEHCARIQVAAQMIGGGELPKAAVLKLVAPKYEHRHPAMWEANLRRLRRLAPEVFSETSTEANGSVAQHLDSISELAGQVH